MAHSIADKLKIREGYTLLSIHAPVNFKNGLGSLPSGVRISDAAKKYDQVHWFVMNRAQLEKEMSKLMKLLKPGIIVWVYYPKSSSNIQTDLTRDKGWDCLLSESKRLTWISLVSFDDTWSVFGFRAKTDADKKKDAKPKPEREIFKWVNPQTKTVKLPGDLSSLLNKHKKQADFFNALSFTNKKEYIEWIVTAKREETRTERLKGTIERLSNGWKNPRNI
jgi:hypothetical protein